MAVCLAHKTSLQAIHLNLCNWHTWSPQVAHAIKEGLNTASPLDGPIPSRASSAARRTSALGSRAQRAHTGIDRRALADIVSRRSGQVASFLEPKQLNPQDRQRGIDHHVDDACFAGGGVPAE